MPRAEVKEVVNYQISCSVPVCFLLTHFVLFAGVAAHQKGFEDLLRTNVPEFTAGVVNRCRRRLGNMVLQAVCEQNINVAVEAYNQALTMPQTETEIRLAIDGFTLNGPWREGSPLLVCFRGAVPHLLKALTERENARGLAFLAAAAGKHNDHLTRFELYTYEAKNFMIMPQYPASLECISTLSVELGTRLFNEMRNAIDFLHKLGFIHMDVKSSNIAVRENGDFVLIDLGSMVPPQQYSESTVVCVPRDFQPRTRENRISNRYRASNRQDWLMLGMTIAEKVYSLDIGGAAQPPTVEALIGMLHDDSFAELIELMRR